MSIFGTNKQRLDLIYSVSEVFAHKLDRILYDSTLLGIRRLTDRAYDTKKKKRNVSILGFADLFKGTVDEETFNSHLKTAKESADFARTWADKKVAHSDLEVKEGGVLLSPVTRAKTNRSIEDIAFVIKWVAQTKMMTSVSTKPELPANDEIWFLKHLYEGVEAMKKKELIYRELTENQEYKLRDEIYQYPDWLDASGTIHDFPI